MLQLYVRVYSDYYTLSHEVHYSLVDSMDSIHEQAHKWRNHFLADCFIIEAGVLRRYRRGQSC